MATLEKAIELAARYHAGQRDLAGKPYITHPLRVMLLVQEQGGGEDAQIVAVLHDALEDTKLTAADLRREGFSEAIVAAVESVTHARSEPYADYVVRVGRSEVGRLVKLADLADNSRLDRATLRPERAGRDLARGHRYVLSYKFLKGGLTEEQYRALMAAHGEAR
jgi:hypothetical protein